MLLRVDVRVRPRVTFATTYELLVHLSSPISVCESELGPVSLSLIKLLIATHIYFLLSPVPDSPRSISINVQNDSHILLQWQRPEHVNGAIASYQVTAQKQPELMTAITWRTNDSSTEILMDHIDPQAVYRISVLAINRMGKGPPVTVIFDLSAGWFLLW